MNNRARIEKLKKDARKHYIAYMHNSDDLDCGHHLSDFIRPDKSEHRTKFNKIMDEIAKLDPDCPKSRL